VNAILARTLRQMSSSEVARMLMDEWVVVSAIPADLVRCPCHDWWYDECDDYRDPSEPKP
jgi:hypothetical protein